MAKQATAEEMAHWPAPNYVDPQTRVGLVLGLTLSTTVLMILFMAARFYGRGRLKSVLGSDDWIMLAAAIVGVGVSIIACLSVKWGLGYHVWDLKTSWSIPYNQAAYGADLLFPICVGLTKVSVCLTYLRLFPSRSNKIVCNGMLVYLALYTVACVLLMLLQCKPIRGYWDPSVKIQCIDIRTTLIAIAALNSVSDFLVFLWPAQYLWAVQLPLKQRVGLVFVFGIGCIVCIAGICRMYYLEVYFNSYDTLWNASIVYAVMTIEQNAGIICGCLPGVKPVLAAFFPKIFGSSDNTRSRPSYGRSNYGANSTHPFQSLSGTTTTKSKNRNDHSVEAIELERGNREQTSYAWAGASATPTMNIPENAIAVSQVVHIDRESKADDRSTEVSKGDADSEEWIIQPTPSPTPNGRR